jgi:hypothetical protein
VPVAAPLPPPQPAQPLPHMHGTAPLSMDLYMLQRRELDVREELWEAEQERVRRVQRLEQEQSALGRKRQKLLDDTYLARYHGYVFLFDPYSPIPPCIADVHAPSHHSCFATLVEEAQSGSLTLVLCEADALPGYA